MKIILSIVLCTFLLIGNALAEEQSKAKSDTMSQKEKLSYSLGYKTGINMKNSSVDIDLETYINALRDGYTGNKAAMTEQEMDNTILLLQKEMKAKQAEKMKGQGDKNKKEGEAFLAENAKKEGVVTLPSGVQYKVVKQGTGRQPAKTDKVKVRYRGTFINGAEFYNSFKSGEPAFNSVDKFIKGLTEGLQLMKEGSRWMIYVPSNLAYGSRGATYGKRGASGAMIGPNQTLIFEVELISIESKEETK